MTKISVIGFLLVLLLGIGHAAGPIYKHDKAIQEEFRHLYTQLDATSRTVLQVKLFTSTNGLAITASSYTETHSSTTFKLIAPSSKVLILANAACRDTLTTGSNARVTIFRDSTDLASDANGFGNFGHTDAGITNIDIACAMTYLDTPSTADEVIYSVRAKVDGAGTFTYGVTGTLVLILVEIGQ